MVFICHVTLQDHVIKALYDFMVRSSSRLVDILPGVVAIGTVVKEIGDITILVYHVILQDHIIKRSRDLIGIGSSKCAIVLPSLVVVEL